MRRRLPIVVGLLLVLGAAGFALAWRPPMAAVDPPSRASFDAALLERGTHLAALGNCAVCHTTVGGAPFAGGLALATPFGTLYSSNITPDAASGVGRWSEAAFLRAMRDGVARDGSQLYPAFPYDHYTRLADADLHALYAYLMTRTPVASTPPANRLHFPFGYRPLVAGWKLLFLDHRPFEADAARSAEWNRGAYLADALAHCGSCHTPRNALGAEHRTAALDGGMADGWYAPPLGARSPSPLPWDVATLTAYLRTGLATDHAIAGGPMREVVGSLGAASESDVQAIATYIVDRMQNDAPERAARAAGARQRAAAPLAADDGAAVGADAGATVYATACASCHDLGRGPSSNAALRLPLAVAVYDADPHSLIRIIREGIAPAETRPGRVMPAFGTALSDAQIVALAAYLRRAAADQPAWEHLPEAVRDTRVSFTRSTETP